MTACSVVRMSLKSISWACSDRPLVWTWYFSFCDRSLAPYLSFIATAQIRRATRPITESSASTPCEVVLQLLRLFVGPVPLLHRDRPDPAGHPADHGVLRVHAVGEEEGQVRREVVDVHAAGEVRLDVGEPVGQRERQLANRVRPGLGDVVP